MAAAAALLSPPLVGGALGLLAIAGLLAYPRPVAWLGLGALVVLTLARWRARGGPLAATPFVLPIGLYLFGGFIGINAVSRGTAYAEIRLTGLLAAAATFFLLLDLIKTIHGARRLAMAALVVTMICLPALLVLTAPVLQTSRLPTPLAEALAAVAAVGQPIRAGLLADATSGQRYRLYGSGLGALAGWGLALGLGLALGSKTRSARLQSLLGAAYCAGFLVLSANRGALLSGVVVACLLGATRYRWLLALVAILMVVGGLALPALADHELRSQLAQPFGVTALSAVDPGPLYVRLDLWRNLLFLMHDFVFTGAGLGLRSGSAVYRDYFRPVDPGFAHAHNGLLQAYLEQGLLGLVGLVGLLALATVVGARALARTRDVDARTVLLASGGAAAALTLASLTEIVMITTLGGVLLFGTLGLLVASARLVAAQEAMQEPFKPERQRSPTRAIRRRSIGTAALVGLGLLSTAVIAAAVLHAGVRARLPAGPRQVAELIAARVTLNFGVVELARARLGPEDELSEHLERADNWLEHASVLQPGNTAIDRARAVAAVTRGRMLEVQRILDDLVSQSDQADSRTRFQLGRIYRHAGDVDGAIAAWLNLDSAFSAWSCSGPDAQLITWSADLVEAGRWSEAIKTSSTAIRLSPTDPAPYPLLNRALVAAEGEAAAEAALLALAREYAEVPWPAQELALLYARLSRPAESLAWQERAAAAHASPAWEQLWLSRARSCTYE